MLILAADTSTRLGSLAILRDEEVLAQMADSSDEPYSSRLHSNVESLLKSLNLSLNRLDLLAVAAGPGSFTGLRVGLTAVKAWAEILDRPIAPVSVLEAVAEQVRVRSAGAFETLFAAVLDARRGQVFGGLYRQGSEDRRLELVGQEVVCGASEFLEHVREHATESRLVFACPTPDIISAAVSDSPFRGSRVEEVSPVLAPVIGLLGYHQALRSQVVDALRLDANYVRRTDAELKLKVE